MNDLSARFPEAHSSDLQTEAGRCRDAARALAFGRASLRCLVGFAAAIAIAGCEENRYHTSGALYRDAYRECMDTLPEGPRATSFNDWDEVVYACRAYAGTVVERTPEAAVTTQARARGQ